MSTGHEYFRNKRFILCLVHCCCWKAMRNEEFSIFFSCHKTAAFACLFQWLSFTSAIFICLAGGQKHRVTKKKILFICDDDDYDEIAVLSMLELFGSLVGNKQHRLGRFVNPLVVYMTVFNLVRISFVYKCLYPLGKYLFLWVMKDGNYYDEIKGTKIKE